MSVATRRSVYALNGGYKPYPESTGAFASSQRSSKETLQASDFMDRKEPPNTVKFTSPPLTIGKLSSSIIQLKILCIRFNIMAV